MPMASRTIPRRGSADLVSVRPDDVPWGAEVVDPLPGRISGIVIGDDVVQRVAGIRHLGRAVVAPRRAEQRCVGARPGLWRTTSEDWRPVGRARAVARGYIALVRLEEVKSVAVAVDQDLAQRRVLRHRDRRGRYRGGWRC